MGHGLLVIRWSGILLLSVAGCSAQEECAPVCTEMYCGADGCGGFCPCTSGTRCVERTQSCCVPDCLDRLCGDDGCDGSCGKCSTGEVCGPDTRRCEPSPCGAGDVLGDGVKCEKQAGACEGATAVCRVGTGWVCDDAAYATNNTAYASNEKGLCADEIDNDCDGEADAKDMEDCCKPDCKDRKCGNDGCKGLCGKCIATESCTSEGICETNCGALAGSTCDGGFCGQQWGMGDCYCLDSQCALDPANCCPDFKSCCGPCILDCTDKICGDDGCGGSCGKCAEGTYCDDTGQCAGSTCGSDYFNSCTDHCGQQYSEFGYCGCGNACAIDHTGCCPDWQSCCGALLNPCIADEKMRCCVGTSLQYCSGQTLMALACQTGSGEACGWYAGDDSSPANYYCAEAGLLLKEDPSGQKPRDCTL